MFVKRSLLAVALFSLAGCNGDNDSATVIVDKGIPELNEMQLSLKGLKKSQNASFISHYKNGIYLSTFMGDVIALAEDSSSTSKSSNVDDRSYSTTITQENGVDEADRVKYDGNHLYIANDGYLDSSLETGDMITSQAGVRILSRQADDSLVTVGQIELASDEENLASINGIFLADNQLSVLSNNHTFYAYDQMRSDIWHPHPQQVNFSLYDVTSVSSPQQQVSYDIDGFMISSRRVDDTLILVTSYTPFIEGLIAFPQTDEDKQKNYDLIQNTDVTDLLPKYTDAAGSTNALVSAEQCFIPEDATSRDGYDAIVTVTTINLDDPSQLNSVCVNASMQGIYATPNSVYIYGTKDEQESVIHKFSLNGLSVDYQGSGNLQGNFGWGQSNLRFSERDGYLRVVSSLRVDDEVDRFDHRLHVFSHNVASQSLALVAQLPNEQQPAKLGKDNEDIYAVRYFGNKAYIVTFLNRDPLYVIDLSDNTNPVIEGELDIIGYSSYLHPISENLVLGIGQNIDPNRFVGTATPEDELSETEEEVVEGAKIALFDVSSAPKLLQEFVFENGYTPAEYNYHALTYLKLSDEKHLFALPIERWLTTQGEEGVDIWSPEVALQLFEVNDTNDNSELVNTGEIIPEIDGNRYRGSWDDRAIIHDDLIYYVHGVGVWQSLWSTPHLVNGPY
ncbi:MAG: beta-propeller domain-containing protein [Litorilituus sp.]|nr:beta-propeller domain-containing protein [Litorilituus sp.]